MRSNVESSIRILKLEFHYLIAVNILLLYSSELGFVDFKAKTIEVYNVLSKTL